tara:strand:+ start:283 stop:876 length:594 start_codon:yes stop_codon:yes gene_type:complete
LVRNLQSVREKFPGYHCRPVGSIGPERARLLVVGLAPGLHGANRTGKPFIGDSSGDFLFQALEKANLISRSQDFRYRFDKVKITNAVKCLPPENRPTMAEIITCNTYLVDELKLHFNKNMRKNRCVLALGSLAYKAVGLAINTRLPRFQHGEITELEEKFWLLSSYHPSRINTNTGRLTAAMLDDVMERLVDLLTVP